MHVAHAAAGRAGTGSRQRETHGLRFWAHGHAALATGNRRAAPASAKGGHDGPPRVAGKPARTAGQAQRGQHAGHTDTALGPAAAWHRQTRRRRRAAPTSSGGSTAGHWPRVAGEPMRTVCEGRAVQLRNACSLGRADQHRSHIEHGLSGTWLGAVNRARRKSTCDAGGVQPRGRGHGEQLAQRGCQSLQGIEAIVTPSHTEAPRLLRQVGVVHEQRMNHDSSRSAS